VELPELLMLLADSGEVVRGAPSVDVIIGREVDLVKGDSCYSFCACLFSVPLDVLRSACGI
jgi:hypothetical protein